MIEAHSSGNENELARIVVDCAYKVHTRLGPGLLESVYEVILAHEVREQGLNVERQVSIPVMYNSIRFEEGFRADQVVADRLLVELKSVEEIHPVHKKQLLTYLRLSNRRLGLLINFGSELIKDGISRVVNGMPD
jgi:GxxExxY protein